MSQTWKHPQLGTFEYDDDRGCWIATCDLPAFKIFTWQVKPKKSTGKYELIFDSSEGEKPSADAAALASVVVANQARLASLITPALWDDFTGRGPKSGMWWHGDLKQVADNSRRDSPKLKGPADLLLAMRLSGLTIHEGVYKHDGAIAEFTFSAVFEEEHGVGVLTDGKTIVGVGYAHDASPFEQ